MHYKGHKAKGQNFPKYFFSILGLCMWIGPIFEVLSTNYHWSEIANCAESSYTLRDQFNLHVALWGLYKKVFIPVPKPLLAECEFPYGLENCVGLEAGFEKCVPASGNLFKWHWQTFTSFGFELTTRRREKNLLKNLVVGRCYNSALLSIWVEDRGAVL